MNLLNHIQRAVYAWMPSGFRRPIGGDKVNTPSSDSDEKMDFYDECFGPNQRDQRPLFYSRVDEEPWLKHGISPKKAMLSDHIYLVRRRSVLPPGVKIAGIEPGKYFVCMNANCKYVIPEPEHGSFWKCISHKCNMHYACWGNKLLFGVRRGLELPHLQKLQQQKTIRSDD